ncbi:MAG: metallophosphoesterase [Planctomycetaceae bacterium]
MDDDPAIAAVRGSPGRADAPSAGRQPRRRWLRRAAMLAGLAGGGGALDAAINHVRLVETRHAFATRPAVGPGPQRPAVLGPQRPVRLVQVSDLHLHAIGVLEECVLERLHAAEADWIVFTGDAIDRPEGLPLLDTFLAECPAGPRRFAIPGNWEYWSGVPLDDHRRIHERHGATWLVNRSVVVGQGALRIRVTGLDDLLGGRPDSIAAIVDADTADAHLLLVHAPALGDRPEAAGADLALAGHTHGGQIAPLGFAPVRPRGSGRFVAGWYHDATAPLYVSRGIGTSGIPLRVGAAPELTIVEWTIG